MTDTEWVAPGPGEWTRLADHFDRPFTAEYERIFTASFEAGMAANAARRPAGPHDPVRTVHGYPFIHPVPLSGPGHHRIPPRSRRLAARPARTGVPALRPCRRRGAAGPTVARHRPHVLRGGAAGRDRRQRGADRDRPGRVSDDGARAPPRGLRGACDRRVPAALRAARHRHVPGRALPRRVPGARHRRRVALDLVVDGIVDLRRSTEQDARLPAVHRRWLRPRPASAVRVHGAAAAGDEVDARRADVREPARPLRRSRPRQGARAIRHPAGRRRAVHPVRDDNGLVYGAWRIGLLRRAYLEAGARLGTEPSSRPRCPSWSPRSGVEARRDRARSRAEERQRWTERRARPARSATTSRHDAFPEPLAKVLGAQLLLRDLGERVPRATSRARASGPSR